MSLSLLIADQEISAVVFNNDFVILKPNSNESALHLISSAIYNSKFDFIDEVIGTEVEICLKLNSNFKPSSLQQLESLEPSKGSQSRTYKLPVFIDADSEDWQLIETYTGIGRDDYLERILKCKFELSMFGFLPGFLYMRGLEKALRVPRKSTPAKRVKTGAVAIGGEYLGIYSLVSPGGWNVIGLSPVHILDMERLPPSEIELGDKLTLNFISEKTYKALVKNPLTITEYNDLL